MAKSGIERIDKLFENAADAVPIKEDDSDTISVGLIQDLLIGHRYKVPGLRSSLRGRVTPGTKKSLKTFRAKHSIPSGPGIIVDHRTLAKLVTEPAADPVASIGYLTLKLNFDRKNSVFVLTLVAVFEGRGKFAAINPNTDRQGLSFGLIQWSQSRKRLSEIVEAFKLRHEALFHSTFGGEAAAEGMAAHVKLGAAGLCAKADVATGNGCKKVGRSKNKAFELTDAAWQGRFATAGRNNLFQKVQVTEALKDIRKIITIIRGYADAITSERGFAFMTDLSNQHGPYVGKHKTGAKAIYQKVVAPELDEKQLMEKMKAESLRIVKKLYGENSPEAKSTEDRRQFFIESKMLSDSPFQE